MASELIISIDLYFWEKGKLIFDSDTVTSSRLTNCGNSDNEKNKNDILIKRFKRDYN
jgi:hypothetical protein